MRTITPTGWGQEKGTPVRQLGSTEAVLEQLPPGSAIIVAGPEAAKRVMALRRDLRHVWAAGSPIALYDIPPETIVGVDVGAFDAVRPEIYQAAHAVLTRRFSTVHWG